MKTIQVTGQSPYTVTIDHGLVQTVVDFVRSTKAENVAILTQPTVQNYAQQLVNGLQGAGLQALPLILPDAEEAKTLAVAGKCWDELGAKRFSRNDLVIGVGGGAVTDLAGFVAASWMRGIQVVQVPTTLLAMVDAAVGGKTGINTEAGKNLVGAFHEPAAVFIDLDLLQTLPQEEIVAGSAEIIKTGFIADPEIIKLYLEDPKRCITPGDSGHLPELIARSVAVKASVVSQDLKESGLREILNYGHTFGHAVELREHFSWRHGNAVAVGMMFIAQLAYQRGMISQALLDTHRNILASVGLPTSYAGGHFPELLAGMLKDKKNRGAHVRFVALTDIAATTRIEDASEEEMLAAYEAISKES